MEYPIHLPSKEDHLLTLTRREYLLALYNLRDGSKTYSMLHTTAFPHIWQVELHNGLLVNLFSTSLTSLKYAERPR